MNKRSGTRVIAFLFALLAATCLYSSNPSLHETVEVSYVNLTITALDKNGHYVNDLSPEDFIITEDGVPQKITDFSHYTPEQTVRRSIGFLIDNSQSMGGAKNSVRKLDLALASARKILSGLNSNDSLSLLLTNSAHIDDTAVISGEALPGAIDNVQVHGGVTLLLDHLMKLINYIADQPGRRFLVVCSDGQDNASKVKVAEILQRAHSADLTIISVGTIESEIAKWWGDAAKREQQDGKKMLEKIADETGGTAFFPVKAEDVAAFPEELDRLLSSQYYVAYQSNNRTGPGWREVRIKCRRSSVKELHYRKGYFAQN